MSDDTGTFDAEFTCECGKKTSMRGLKVEVKCAHCGDIWEVPL